MKDQIMQLLKCMEAAIPPPENCHHALTFARYGSDSDGWQDKLALQINNGGLLRTYFLEEEDFAVRPENLAQDVADLEAEPDPNAQIAVNIGQFLPNRAAALESVLRDLLIDIQLSQGTAQLDVNPARAALGLPPQ